MAVEEWEIQRLGSKFWSRRFFKIGRRELQRRWE
jgi:hypothetical protein